MNKPTVRTTSKASLPNSGISETGDRLTNAEPLSLRSEHKFLAWLPIVLLSVAMVFFRAANFKVSYESNFLVLALNFIFSTLASVFIAYLVARSFLVDGSFSVLLLGCGAIAWGGAGVLANFVSQGKPDLDVTIHNCCVWISALFHLVGAILLLQRSYPTRRAAIWLGAGYLGAIAAIGLTAFWAASGHAPTFFVPGVGGTPVRQFVLTSSILMFLLAAVLIQTSSRGTRSSFPFWYILALVAISVGLVGILFQSAIGSLLAWSGRAALCLGGAYMVLAALALVRESGLSGLGLYEALREREERLRQAGDLVGLCPYTWYPLTGAFEWSARLKEVWGLAPQSGETYHAWLGGIYPEDRASVERNMAQSLNPDHGRVEAEFRVLRPDGTQRWVLTRGRTRFVDGRPVSHLGLAVDATQRKQSEQALRESEERFRALVTATSDVVYRMSPDWKEMRELRGRNLLSDTEAPSQTWLERYIEVEDQPRVLAAIREAISSQSTFELEHRVRRADGSLGWTFSRAIPLRNANGEIIEWFGAASDVSSRKKMEEELLQRERQFRTLADSIPNLAWWANADGYITWYNRRWYEYTGTTPEQMEGWGWQSVHDPAMLPKVLEQWQASLRSKEPFEMEFPLRGANGRFRWFLTRIVPLLDAMGNVVRWFGTNTDISEARAARDVLTRSKDELEKLVIERTTKLQELVGELEHFSYSITHDMRAPLRAMRGFAQVITDPGTHPLSEEQRMFLGRIITAAERMDGLITDALNYSKVVRQELPLAPIDLGKLLRGMCDSYPEFQASEADIYLMGEFPPVMGNEAGLTQCFSNLLGNAVKFVQPGKRAEVKVRSETRDGWVRVWVEDNGVGISPSTLPRVFDMFSHGQDPRAGTGIGLALVRKVVDRMGGKVGVESEPLKGSRFWVELKSGQPGH